MFFFFLLAFQDVDALVCSSEQILSNLAIHFTIAMDPLQ